ncbi:MAG: hypothetical protein EZS28_000988 [Streblomastix strix]|uniref:Uncharacterized protein n=1 Tax=Streblomastix strix TaxID=222440 RepID=A0A5J4X8B0_9EUKA|nr:MAG: hypothetical protein EZS28_000988 [Streblomastix strix]
MSSEQHKFIKYTGGKMYMCGSQTDVDRIHFVEGDTDSAYWGISGNPNEDFTQQFNAVISDRDFYNKNAKYFFPRIRGDVYDEKKILGLSIERQGIAMNSYKNDSARESIMLPIYIQFDSKRLFIQMKPKGEVIDITIHYRD